jgi:hypothetical protein
MPDPPCGGNYRNGECHAKGIPMGKACGMATPMEPSVQA